MRASKISQREGLARADRGRLECCSRERDRLFQGTPASRTRCCGSAVMHRRFGTRQTSPTRCKRYDRVLVEQPEQAPLRRVLAPLRRSRQPAAARRLGRRDTPIRPSARLRPVLRSTGIAALVRRDAAQSCERRRVRLTHVMLTWCWVTTTVARWSLPDGFLDRVFDASAAIDQ